MQHGTGVSLNLRIAAWFFLAHSGLFHVGSIASRRLGILDSCHSLGFSRGVFMPNNVLLNRQLLDKLPTGAYLCNAEGLIVYFNDHAAQMWGRTPTLNEPMDRFCGSFRLYHSDGRTMRHDECWMALALKTRQEYNGVEVIIERPDGTRRTGLGHVSPIFDEAGNLEAALNIVVDISDRKEAERANAFLRIHR